MSGYDVRISPLAAADFIDLKGGEEFQQLAATALAVEFPNAANSMTGGDDGLVVYCISPGHWLLQLNRGACHEAVERIEIAARDVSHSCVDVSDLYARIEVTGKEARDVLAQGISLDLHDRVFPPGSTARTALTKTTVQLTCTDQRPGYELLVFSSFERYVLDWLNVAAATNESVLL